MTSEAFDDALSRVEDHVETIGGTVAGPISESPVIAPDNPEIHGFDCRHGTEPYLITALEDDAYFSIRFPRSIIFTVADQLSDETLRQFSKNSDLKEGEREQAALDWIHQADEELLGEIHFHLRERLSEPEVAFTSNSSDKMAPLSFEVSRKIFPYSDSLDVTEFNNSVQSVVSVGVMGMNYISTVFNLGTDLSDSPELTTII